MEQGEHFGGTVPKVFMRVSSRLTDGLPVRASLRNGLVRTGFVHALTHEAVDTAVFDGEFVALGPDGRASFQRLQNHASNPDSTLRYYVFDVLYLDGYDLRSAP